MNSFQMSEIESPNCNTKDLHKHQDYHTVNTPNILKVKHLLYMLNTVRQGKLTLILKK